MKAYISLGSNLGDRADRLDAAVRMLGELPGVRVRAVSPVYETDPVEVREQPRFLNLVAEVETELDPEELLTGLQSIEAALGRSRIQRWGPRTIDLDLLLCGDRVVASEKLEIPHPRMCERRFVLEPLADLAPDLPIPGRGRTVRELLENVRA
jgi:2-amino-4-hydroxy-6-hydroxymethyldihydropteridine diphosphokinase